MFKIALDDELCFSIVSNDRGDWWISSDSGYSATQIEGFGGENIVSIFLSHMQSGRTDVLIVHVSCDAYIRTAHGSTLNHFDNNALANYINELLREDSLGLNDDA